MADTAPPPRSPAWDPATNPTRAWAQLREQAHTDEQRACLAAATRQTDRVWVALHSGLLGVGAKEPTVRSRTAAWFRLALSAYEVLMSSGAYGHLAHLRPLVCACAETVLTAWLNSPAPSEDRDAQGHDGQTVTVAQQLGVGDAVHAINADTQNAHLSTVLSAAQDAGVFGVPRHRVELVTAANHHHHDSGTIVRVLVDTPTEVALASEPLQLAVLVDPEPVPEPGHDVVGVDATIAALRRVADVATGLFAAHARAVWTAPPPIPTDARDQTTVGRAFPQLRLSQRAAPPVPPTPAQGPGAALAPRPAPSPDDRIRRPR